ncbi:hypothetical protein O3M35_012134 [Rhynocoris fuscipes]|uniref:Fatty acyl-CoA reductase n=1 Tax=Rhynocoris fuscipes TaxID=488301 RepID=A0AAW1CSJ8_9HEMI
MRYFELQVFAHLSTAFCHCEEDILEEKLYSPPYNPHDILSVVNWMDDQMLEAVTPTLLDKHPNCYTFTKRLAEGLMHEYSSKIPIAVIRPSIVVPALKEPIPGWVDSLNGPIGVMVAAGKGVLRSMLCKPDNRAEVIPVDVAINCIIILTWARAQSKCRTKDVEVSNLSSGEILPVTWGEIVGIGREVIKEYPYDAGLWYPGGTMRTNPFTHAIVVFLCQILPAYFIDFIMLLTRNKRFMVRVQNRISLGMELLQYFTMRQWNFSTPKSKEIRSCLSDKESDIFYLPFDGIDIRRFLIDSIIGSRVFCLKEPLENLDRARKHLKW